MKITGELLKNERINSKLNVQDIARTLKLSSKIINAMEAGDIGALPSKTFVRWFVKSYAQLLKLDAEVVLRQFQEEMGSTSPVPKIPPPATLPNDHNIKAPRPTLKQTAKSFSVKHSNTKPNIRPDIKTNGENNKKIFFMISIASVLIMVLIVTNKIIENFNNNPTAQISDDEALFRATTIKSADLTPVSAQASADATPVKISNETATPENGFQVSSGKPVELLIEAKKATEIFYARGDSQQLVPLSLAANQIYILRSEVGLHFRSNEAGAIKISVNGVGKLFPSTHKELKLTF